jgi:hypothetical protein
MEARAELNAGDFTPPRISTSSPQSGNRLTSACIDRTEDNRVLGENTMSKEDDYRQNAANSMRLAQRASSCEDKGRLLRLAEAWLDLADRVHGAAKQLRRPTLLHPLIQKKLD